MKKSLKAAESPDTITPLEYLPGWRKLYQNGNLSADSSGEAMVPGSELEDALAQVREQQQLLGRKTMENEILREAVDVMKSRTWISHSRAVVGRGCVKT